MAGDCWLVTGGAGYIGSHVVRALLASGQTAVVIDDLSTGHLGRINGAVPFFRGSVLNTSFVREVIEQTSPLGVVHLAAKKSPTESVADPLLYARENVGAVVSLLEAMRQTGVLRVVFSSSCSVYGTPTTDLVAEDATPAPLSPYGESKLYGEMLFRSAASAYGLAVVNLRYFNVVGADGPELRDTGAYNLVPLIFRALKRGVPAKIFGTDYDTPDGTCVRDYVDVRDLADAHVRAAETLPPGPHAVTYNVGRGVGSSVLDVIEAAGTVTGRPVSYEVAHRRPGDPPRVVGCVDRIARELGWQARHDLTSMVNSAWIAECG